MRGEWPALARALRFAGVMVMPSAFAVAVAASGEYAAAYTAAGLLAAASGALLLGGVRRRIR